MKNEIQKLILELKLKKIESIENMNKYRHDEWRKSIPFIHEASAFNFCIQKLKLLLKDESKQPQPPDFANTMLGKVPQVVNDGTEENGRAVEGATPVVRQNEQMQKVCVCGREIKYEPFASQEWHCECGEIYKRKPADAPAPDL